MDVVYSLIIIFIGGAKMLFMSIVSWEPEKRDEVVKRYA